MSSAPELARHAREIWPRLIRTRQRRVWMSVADRFDLQALGAIDDAIDADVQALALLGEEAVRVGMVTDVLTDSAVERSAWVHAVGAVLVQMPAGARRDAALRHWVSAHVQAHWLALRDAFWFFPVPLDDFHVRDDALDVLAGLAMDMAGSAGGAATTEPGASVASLLVEVIGRTAHAEWALALRPGASLARQASAQARRLAMARSGVLQTEELVRCLVSCRASGAPGGWDACRHAFRLLACTGRVDLLEAPEYLGWATAESLDLRRLAWWLAAVRDPRWTQQQALRDDTLEVGIRGRVLALAGYADGLITVAGQWLSSAVPEGGDRLLPLEPAMRDLLVVMTGTVPAVLRSSDPLATACHPVLREAVLKLLRRSHVEVRNQADQSPWSAAEMLADVEAASRVRLRGGRRLDPAGQRVLHADLGRLTAPMRQMLYIEHARQHGTALGLSAWDVARRQRLAIGLSQWAGDWDEVAAAVGA